MLHQAPLSPQLEEWFNREGKPFASPETKKFTLENARGGQVDGVTIHSVRLPGLVANQEVVFGGPGQTLSIKTRYDQS